MAFKNGGLRELAVYLYAGTLIAMISILIPTYNYNPTNTVRELHSQCTELGIAFEILVADDDPDSEMASAYAHLNELEHVHASINPVNLGRRGNRDYLASKARYEWLLYLDEDAVITHRSFVNNYLSNLKPGVVICGGVDYCATLSKAEKKKLRYRYGLRSEVVAATDRNSAPYSSFITFNFLIPKEIYLKLPKHTEIVGYGHEDTMMGYDLKYNFVPILHIDNAACHSQIDSNEVFLEKTKEALQNLSRMMASGKVDEEVRMYKAYARVRATGLHVILRVLYSLIGKELESHILHGHPKLWLFDLYRLMYLSYIQPQITTPGAWR
ncbi:MAG: glycosyltransferase [Thermaurantimonas sp.]|uniref:glycosyltransferase n=1 Tax=Thermaurantimonas sp. TaxID=2681568 RepID=UPI00391B9DD7